MKPLFALLLLLAALSPLAPLPSWAEDDIDDDISDILEDEKEKAEEEAEERLEKKLEQLLEQRFGKGVDFDDIEDELEGWLEQQLEDHEGDEDLDERLERELEKRLEALGSDMSDQQLDLLDDKFQQLWQLEDDLNEALLPALPEQAIALLSQQELQEAIQQGAKILDENPLGELGAILVTFDHRAPIPPQSTPNHLYQLDSTQSAATSITQDALAQAQQMGVAGQLIAKQRIGMMDSSIHRTHPCLENSIIHQKAFHPDGKPNFAHGTAMASIILGKAGCGAAGILSQGELYNAVVFAQNEQNLVVASAAQLVQGLNWLLSQRVGLINMSLSGPANATLEKALRQVAARGVTLLASAGNDGPAAFARFPAAYPEVIAVTAVDSQLAAYPRAAQGPHIEIAAPGVAMQVANQNSTGSLSGTSLASALATAILASEPAFRTRPDLSQRALDLGEKGRDKVFGFGLLQKR
ncbi:Hypothetical protein HDN1F_22200 [gamma proteobacterium HdN1]|nr:Hypothetical protein HDN1F_22200 [gamma proteobacterium HdN1]